ncbi:hypothetical protein PVAND_001129 [Polypedilum vanderplanki]|uniref:BTB domain-containing protein n=1 Tax=Polypedilum vanderplanki TaxID=319348 RepID=A0A9J6BMA3_POLVA|nr:hypothetical protein PVAND_001129 [Polypedilum vanderplanki]
MNDKFKFFLSFNQSKLGLGKFGNFKNDYGLWFIRTNGNPQSFTGTIGLDPAFDKNLVDWKQIEINVRLIKSAFNRHSDTIASVTARYLEKNIFKFGLTKSMTGDLTQINFSCIVEINMPIILNNKKNSKRDGAKNHLKSMFESGNDADITIMSEGKELKVHNFILKRSEVFSKMFSGEMKESRNRIVVIEDIKHEVIVEMCRYLYYDEIPKIKSLALPLLVAASKYLIDDLVEECEDFLMTNITLDNYHEVIVIADQLNKEKLREAAIDYIITNCKSIFPSTAWKELKTSHVQLALTVMEKFMLTFQL